MLFDQGTPVPLRNALPGNEISTAYELGWSTLKNRAAAYGRGAGFEVLVTTDTNLRYQQDLKHRRIAIVVLLTTSWPRIRGVVEHVATAVDSASAGSYVEVAIP